jgi:hypothetical protein
MSEAAIIETGKSTEREKFSFSKEEDGVKRTVRGEEVENGWIITVEKEWEEKNPATGQSDWKYGTWKYISSKDPREVYQDKQQQQKVPIPDEATSILNSVASAGGLLIV